MRRPGPRDPRKWPLGRVAPDDPYENTRDHERIWFEIDRLKRKPCACDGGTSLVGSTLSSVVADIGDCTGWWRLGEAPTFPALDGANHTIADAFVDSADFEGTSRDADYLETQVVGQWSGGVVPAGFRPTFGIAGGGGDDDGAIQFNGNPGYAGAIIGNQPYPYLSAGMGSSLGGDLLAKLGTATDNAKTVACWMKPKNYSSPAGSSDGIGFAFSNLVGSGTGGWGFYHKQDPSSDKSMGFFFGTDASAGAHFVGRAATVVDTWYFLAATWDGTTLRFYIDGVLEASSLVFTSTGGGNVSMGLGRIKNGFSDNDFPYYGGLDECFTFRKVLTPSEILRLKNASGDVPPAGWIATADGAGGITWVAP